MVPKVFVERLPPAFRKVLLTRYQRFEGSELHHTVLDLILGYRINHGLTFPEIPASPLLLRYIKDLALPRTFARVA